MAARTYKTKALVLRKRKLREKDLIVILLCEDGTLKSALAKGARKPGGSHAARLELFRCADLMLAQGSLDIICESRLERTQHTDAFSLEQTTCASPVAELLSYVAQEGLKQPRLFDLARASFEHISKSSDEQLLTLCGAALWKVLAQVGYRPSFTHCVRCGAACLEQDMPASSHSLAFSALEGGCICASCPAPGDATRIDKNLAQWCEFLINSRFDTICTQPLDPKGAFAVLSLVRQWTSVHIGKRLASLDFVFSSGLFEAPQEKGISS